MRSNAITDKIYVIYSIHNFQNILYLPSTIFISSLVIGYSAQSRPPIPQQTVPPKLNV